MPQLASSQPWAGGHNPFGIIAHATFRRYISKSEVDALKAEMKEGLKKEGIKPPEEEPPQPEQPKA